MAEKDIPRARMNGSIVILPDKRVRIPDTQTFVEACRKSGVDISVRKTIIRGLEYIYGPVKVGIDFNSNTLYSALNFNVRLLPEWQAMHKKCVNWHNERKLIIEEEKKKSSDFNAYMIDFVKRVKRNSLKRRGGNKLYNEE